MFASEDHLFFIVSNHDRENVGLQLWASDGTADGTLNVANQLPGGLITSVNFSGNPLSVAVQDRMYFIENQLGPIIEGAQPDWLWQSDGSADGTHRIALPKEVGTAPKHAQAVGDRLYFASTEGSIWYVDRENQVQKVKSTELETFDVDDLTETDGKLVIAHHERLVDAPRTLSMTVIDGEIATTTLVGEYSRGLLAASTDGVFYEAKEGDQEYLYDASQGNFPGAKVVDTSAGLSQARVDGNHLFFVMNDSVWRTDGVQTLRVADLGDVSIASSANLTITNDVVVLPGTIPTYGDELFRISANPELLVGDIDNDFDVDFADFLALSANFGKQVDATLAEGDINADGKIDFDDFLLLSGNFGSDLKP